jgi:hypothetical protein
MRRHRDSVQARPRHCSLFLIACSTVRCPGSVVPDPLSWLGCLGSAELRRRALLVSPCAAPAWALLRLPSALGPNRRQSKLLAGQRKRLRLRQSPWNRLRTWNRLRRGCCARHGPRRRLRSGPGRIRHRANPAQDKISASLRMRLTRLPRLAPRAMRRPISCSRLGDSEGHHAVDAHAGQHERHLGQAEEQNHGEAIARGDRQAG